MLLPFSSCLFVWLSLQPALFAKAEQAAPAVQPLQPQDDDLLVVRPPGIGAWPVPKLFERQERVCTDPAYSTQCAAVIANGNCCGTSTYCCPDNLAFCCTKGDTEHFSHATSSAKSSKASRAAARPTAKPATGDNAPP
ncbi:uncharacterized protein H6S33_002919 [Morchella sextelata]|uniref:uncharacterized protein n=1 Tax=Morchella sextelata TaxID=1174677 RepID=UPI001D056FD0|nr:uncharacterized protein H6S33_002919 [Morchella sextelata]KAH0606931.1 hypothetical protein H6S33_002919 [Morchella sextelata]